MPSQLLTPQCADALYAHVARSTSFGEWQRASAKAARRGRGSMWAQSTDVAVVDARTGKQLLAPLRFKADACGAVGPEPPFDAAQSFALAAHVEGSDGPFVRREIVARRGARAHAVADIPSPYGNVVERWRQQALDDDAIVGLWNRHVVGDPDATVAIARTCMVIVDVDLYALALSRALSGASGRTYDSIVDTMADHDPRISVAPITERATVLFLQRWNDDKETVYVVRHLTPAVRAVAAARGYKICTDSLLSGVDRYYSVSANGTYWPPKVRRSLLWCPFAGAGTARCDRAGCLATRLAVPESLQCSRCERAVYCSAACQLADWAGAGGANHRAACRAAGARTE